MRKCSICTHDKRQEIEHAILDGTPYRNIAKQFHLSIAAISRHAKGHLPAKLVEAEGARYLLDARKLFSRVESLITESEDLIAYGKGKNGTEINARAWSSGIREMRSCLELLARMSGELNERQKIQINIIGSAEWVALRSKMIVALEPYPDARRAIVEAIGE